MRLNKLKACFMIFLFYSCIQFNVSHVNGAAENDVEIDTKTKAAVVASI